MGSRFGSQRWQIPAFVLVHSLHFILTVWYCAGWLFHRELSGLSTFTLGDCKAVKDLWQFGYDDSHCLYILRSLGSDC